MTYTMTRSNARQVLERTRAACASAFKLITPDDARREGFFRTRNPVIDELFANGVITTINLDGSSHEKTEDKVDIYYKYDICHEYLITLRGYKISVSSFGRIVLLSDAFPVRIMISFSESADGLAHINPAFWIYSVEVIGVLERKVPEGIRAALIPRAAPASGEFGIAGLDLSILTMPHGSGVDDLAGFPHVHLDPAPVQAAYQGLIRSYPQNNCEVSRALISLLAGFEAMLESAIRHMREG